MLLEILMLFLAPAAEADTGYTHYSQMNAVFDIAVDGETAWCATSGGVVRWDLTTGDNRMYNRDDGVDTHMTVIYADNDIVCCSRGSSLLMLDDGEWTEHPLPGMSGCDIITVDSYGRYWFGNRGALAMWDGENLEWINQYTTDGGLADNTIHDILSIDNEVWFATDAGLSVLDGETWRTYTVESGLPDNEIRDLEYTPDGILWAVTGQGAAKFHGGTWTPVPFDDTSRPDLNSDLYFVASISGETAYFGTRRYGIAMYDRGAITFFDMDSSPLLDNRISALAITPGGSLLVSSGQIGYNRRGSGLQALTDGKWRTYLCDGPLNYSVTRVAAGSDGAVYCMGNGGIAGFDGESWTYYTGEDCSTVWKKEYASAVDASGVIWYIESFSRGVVAVKGGEETHYTAEDGLAEGAVHVIAAGPDNTVWFATQGGVSSFDGTTWTVWNGAGSPGDTTFRDITVDNDGVVWVAAGKSGLWRYDGAWDNVITGEDIWRVEADGNGAIWVGSYMPFRLFRYADGVRDYFDEISTIQALDIAVDSSGTIWVATYDGLISFPGGTVTAVDEEAQPETFSLSSFPNPFNPSTTIAYTLPDAGHVTLDVYSLTGQKVATLVDAYMGSGKHTAVFDGSGYASGMYFYRLISDGITQTGKMLLMK